MEQRKTMSQGKKKRKEKKREREKPKDREDSNKTFFCPFRVLPSRSKCCSHVLLNLASHSFHRERNREGEREEGREKKSHSVYSYSECHQLLCSVFGRECLLDNSTALPHGIRGSVCGQLIIPQSPPLIPELLRAFILSHSLSLSFCLFLSVRWWCLSRSRSLSHSLSVCEVVVCLLCVCSCMFVCGRERGDEI